MRMIDPPSFISGKAFCTVNSVPFTLRSKSLSKCSSVRLAKGANSPTPALATRTTAANAHVQIRDAHIAEPGTGGFAAMKWAALLGEPATTDDEGYLARDARAFLSRP